MSRHPSQHRFLTKSPIINVMAEAAFRAGKFLIKDFNELDKLKISKKSARDFVSNADTFAEKNIREELEKARPGFSFLMEESGEVQGEDPNNRWIIDPLDGTFNFLRGFPHFCISIAHEKDGKINAGLIYAPLTDEIFWAENGSGAFLNQTRLRVSTREDMNEALVATHPTDKFPEAVKRFGSVRITGSTALDLAYVAAGRFDGFFVNRFSPWDVAAGSIIIQEAGGYIESYEGKPWPYEGQTIVTGSPHAFPPLKELVRD